MRQCRETITSYTDLDGNLYYAVGTINEPWVNKMIEKYGLENLIKEYPYQPLVLNENGKMEATDGTCNGRATNIFHIIYHIQIDNQRKQQVQQQKTVEQQNQQYLYNQQVRNNNQNNYWVPEFERAFYMNQPNRKSQLDSPYMKMSLSDFIVANNDPSMIGMDCLVSEHGKTIMLNPNPVNTTWHPNKDPYGNYIGPNGEAMINNGYYNQQQYYQNSIPRYAPNQQPMNYYQQQGSYIPQYREAVN